MLSAYNPLWSLLRYKMDSNSCKGKLTRSLTTLLRIYRKKEVAQLLFKSKMQEKFPHLNALPSWSNAFSSPKVLTTTCSWYVLNFFPVQSIQTYSKKFGSFWWVYSRPRRIQNTFVTFWRTYLPLVINSKDVFVSYLPSSGFKGTFLIYLLGSITNGITLWKNHLPLTAAFSWTTPFKVKFQHAKCQQSRRICIHSKIPKNYLNLSRDGSKVSNIPSRLH